MNLMMKIIEDLAPLNRVFCSDDYDKSVTYLQEILPFQVIEYTKKDEHNGWVIAPRWNVSEGKIIKNGKVIYDGMKHALAVISLSKSFRGRVDCEELKGHLHFDNRYDDAIPFHFRQMYRPWEREWGFCVTKRFYDSLGPGEYEVVIETRESEGTLKLLEYTHQGELSETIVIAAHLDHPGMANDDMAGCAAGVELFRRLRERKTKYTYKLFLHQEVIGSEYYLAKMADADRRQILESLFLEMLGSETQLALQESRHSLSNIEKALSEALEERNTSYRKGAFDSIVTNGDYIWEAYGIPMASLSRYPYPEYHCDKDNLTIISQTSLNQAVNILWRAVDILESSTLVRKKFEGNICVSNPKYDLYIELGTGQESVNRSTGTTGKKLRTLMDMVPMLNRPVSSRILAEKIDLSEDVVLNYLKKWSNKGLLDLM
jgi:aminopeptidase-like protein